MKISRNILFFFKYNFPEGSSKLNLLKNWNFLLLLNNQRVLNLFLDIIAEGHKSSLDVLQEFPLLTENS